MATANSRLSLRLKVSLRLFVLGLAAVAIAAAIHRNNTLAKQALAALEGRWSHISTEAGGVTYSDVHDRDHQVWEIVGDKLTRYVDLVKKDIARIDLQSSAQPLELDLIPTDDASGNEKSGFVTRTRCLYSLRGDDLKVAITCFFGPSTPDQEHRQAMKDAQTRPESFDTKMSDVVWVMTFKRENRDRSPN